MRTPFLVLTTILLKLSISFGQSSYAEGDIKGDSAKAVLEPTKDVIDLPAVVIRFKPDTNITINYCTYEIWQRDSITKIHTASIGHSYWHEYNYYFINGELMQFQTWSRWNSYSSPNTWNSYGTVIERIDTLFKGSNQSGNTWGKNDTFSMAEKLNSLNRFPSNISTVLELGRRNYGIKPSE